MTRLLEERDEQPAIDTSRLKAGLQMAMSCDSQFQLSQMLERILNGECATRRNKLPIIDAILERLSPEELKTLAKNYGVVE